MSIKTTILGEPEPVHPVLSSRNKTPFCDSKTHLGTVEKAAGEDENFMKMILT